MSNRDINDLIEPAQVLFHEFRIGMDQANVSFMITSVKRTKDEQIALYTQGRETLIVVNDLRRLADLPPISAAENTRKVTWTLKSRHLPLEVSDPLCVKHPEWIGKCLAFDIAILKGKRPVWDLKVDVDSDGIPDYKEAADIARSIGFKVGADFKPNADYPHIEFDRRKA